MLTTRDCTTRPGPQPRTDAMQYLLQRVAAVEAAEAGAREAAEGEGDAGAAAWEVAAGEEEEEEAAAEAEAGEEEEEEAAAAAGEEEEAGAAAGEAAAGVEEGAGAAKAAAVEEEEEAGRGGGEKPRARLRGTGDRGGTALPLTNGERVRQYDILAL
ncbi:hypothetical protein HYH03_016552 [Edaphochlamys debaryana]|uniref:Uncharacterized protein n=1 Tax=Edaphochlamys debaryana TaxID=47281 RepID=A0A836BQ57_9CHLO|nr:hypothetical protein HYH03_016552 [Edaphochlamys debaryana]|eukprot:KAG2484662.1 hypothetical protein HYH03_016552 [Edaphochlamys debaryana]